MADVSNPATISVIDGLVRFGEVKKGLREIFVVGEGVEKVYKLPHGTHLRVHDGESVAAGDRLSFSQEDIKIRGHAIEYRVNAEDPFNNFTPAPGPVEGRMG